MLKKILLASLFGLFQAGVVHGQTITDARALSMGGAFTAVARNHVATYYNPANLGIGSPRSFSMVLGLPSVSFDLHNTSFETSILEEYSGVYLTQEDKDDILAMVADGFGLKSTLGYDLFGLSLGRFAMGVNFELFSGMFLPQAPLEILLNGTAAGRDITLADIKGDVHSALVTSFSYAFPLDGIKPLQPMFSTLGITRSSFGITAKHIAGLASAQLRATRGGLNIDDYHMDADIEMTLRMAGTVMSKEDDRLDFDFTPGIIGSGRAFDIGLATQHGNNLTLGLVLRNLGGKITWDKDTYEARFTFETERLNAVDISQKSDGDDLYASSDTTYAVSPYTVKLPAVISIGAAYKLRTPTLLSIFVRDITASVDIQKGFSEALGMSKNTRISAGLEQGLFWNLLPVRFGVSRLGEHTITAVGIGLNLPLIKWDIAFINHGVKHTKGGSIATSFWFGF